jgi:hypothetical protein
MEQELRNKLRNVVTQCRKLLEDAISQELEGKYGIFAKKDHVTADPDAPMTHLTDEEREARKDILDHFGHIRARGFKPKEALDQLVREIAFTHLNRLCAYKMMEAREVYVGGQKFREAVSRGINSIGVKWYLADRPEEQRLFETGRQDLAYQHFLDWLGGVLSEEIGVLFNPNDPANRLYPRQKTLNEVLKLLNEGGIKPEETALREAWPQIWAQDETIGWVYQYFTPKEIREQAKDPERGGSDVPRNSYELAFRNQFFTPRYVVEFLTDNTLGRIWYEMRKGSTRLKEQCRLMVYHPTEIFLKPEDQPPKDAAEALDNLSQEELLKLPVHVPHRMKKDPRDLNVLDPACGSGHFLLYCFDLLQTIYEEAYADPDLGPSLQKDYPSLQELRRDVPRLILAHNLHGVDIDMRASQIAALALWLRCQRAYHEMGLKKDRPIISRSNFVCAEPMPGEEPMLKEFVAQLEPKLLGRIVEVVFEKMKLAGEAGSLIRIDEEIQQAVFAAKKQWMEETTHATDRQGQPLLFSKATMERLAGKPEQARRFDLGDITDEQFFEEAEGKVIEALRAYAEKVQNGHRLQRRLFTEDTVRGFAFIDLCRKRYDVVLMNPPFGEVTAALKPFCNKHWSAWNSNVLCAFLLYMWDKLQANGLLGTIFDRTVSVKTTYEDFRRSSLCAKGRLLSYVDLGWGVLDANVETAMAVLSRCPVPTSDCADVRNVTPDRKSEYLQEVLSTGTEPAFKVVGSGTFASLPNAIVGYDFPHYLLTGFLECSSLEQAGYKAYSAHTLKAEKHNRLWWEIAAQPPVFCQPMFNGSSYSPYSTAFREVAIAEVPLYDLPRNSTTILRNRDVHGKPGICFSKRGDVFCCHAAPAGLLFTQEGRPLPVWKEADATHLLALLNTPLFRFALNKLCGQHKSGGYINMFPLRTLGERSLLQSMVTDVINEANVLRAYDETQRLFAVLCACRASSLRAFVKELTHRLSRYRDRMVANLERESERQARLAYRASELDVVQLDNFAAAEPTAELPIDDVLELAQVEWFVGHSIISFAIGVVLGRWDIRLQQVGQQQSTQQALFAPLASVPPATLSTANVIAAPGELADYPIDIQWNGILVDDASNPDDVVLKVQAVFESLWGDNGVIVEQDACQFLSMKDLRDYFQKSGSGGFWDDHVNRYSKNRRKAPIYWLLQSSKKNYALWLYYHRIDKDLLFKAIVNYVEPKIRLETSRIETLRQQKLAAGESGREPKRLAKELERQEDFLSELQDFEDKLRRAADLHLEPDLSDGVVLNIAPLHELVPWKEAENYWEELLAGKYEWSSIARQLRQKGLVK